MSSDASQKPNLYEQIGGRPGVESLIYAFYDRVLADPELRDYFTGASVERLRNMQLEFFSAALGGPTVYQGTPIAHAHHHLGITRASFQRFVDHLFETLKDFPVGEQDRYDIISRINLYSGDVLGMGEGEVP